MRVSKPTSINHHNTGFQSNQDASIFIWWFFIEIWEQTGPIISQFYLPIISFSALRQWLTISNLTSGGVLYIEKNGCHQHHASYHDCSEKRGCAWILSLVIKPTSRSILAVPIIWFAGVLRNSWIKKLFPWRWCKRQPTAEMNNYALDLFRETLMLQNFIWNSLHWLRVSSSGNLY